MKKIMKIGLMVIVFCALCTGCRTTDVTTTHDRSPHAEAIAFVMKTQGDVIKTIDKENWWHDTKARTWTATRTFAPGTLDSTHLFQVEYRVDDKVVAKWLVDTGRKSVQKSPEK